MLSTILQYSTLDIRFLDANLKQVCQFSDEVIIPICSNFFDGSKEDEQLMDFSLSIIEKYKNVKYHFFEWEAYNGSKIYYNTLSRKIGTDLAKNDWLLFIDGDEIFEDRFKDWFPTICHQDIAWVFKCYWYFREPIYRAIQKESAGLLVKRHHCRWDLHNNLDRQQLYQPLWDNNILEHADAGDFGKHTFLHHFSWVRTREQMLKKVQSWGHDRDKNWISLVEEEFSREFNGTDFVHGYQYEVVDNLFNI